MAKIYETIDDARRDDLKLRIERTAASKREAGNTFSWSLITGALALMLDRAKEIKPFNIGLNLNWKKPRFIEKLEQTRVYKAYDTFFTFLEKHGLKLATGIAAASALIEGIICLHERKEHKKALEELNRIGWGKEIIQLEDGTSVELPHDSEALKHFLQDAPEITPAAKKQVPTTIHVGKDLESERLQTETGQRQSV